MANPLSNPAGNVVPRWVYQAILVEMTDKTLYGLRATQRHKAIRGIFSGGVSPLPHPAIEVGICSGLSCLAYQLSCAMLFPGRLRGNKANLGDLIAATGLVIVLKFDPNHQFFSPCDLEIWCMTLKNNQAPLLCYFKLCAAFRTHWWIQTGVTVRKRPIWVKFDDF